MQLSWKEFAVGACILASGCSSSSTSGSGGGSCSAFSACGGNVVGTWNFTKGCLSDVSNPLAMTCPSSTFSETETLGGSVTFTANTYTSSTSGSAEESVTLPSSCLTFDGGVTVTCAELQADLTMSIGDAGPPPTGTCMSSSGGCACQVTFTAPSTSEMGTYTTSNSTITLTPANQAPGNPVPYCVQGNTLLVQSQPADPAAGTPGIVIVATKQ